MNTSLHRLQFPRAVVIATRRLGTSNQGKVVLADDLNFVADPRIRLEPPAEGLATKTTETLLDDAYGQLERLVARQGPTDASIPQLISELVGRIDELHHRRALELASEFKRRSIIGPAEMKDAARRADEVLAKYAHLASNNTAP